MTKVVKVFLDHYNIDEVNQYFTIWVSDPFHKNQNAAHYMFSGSIENPRYKLLALMINNGFSKSQKKVMELCYASQKVVVDPTYTLVIDFSRIKDPQFDIKKVLDYFVGNIGIIN